MSTWITFILFLITASLALISTAFLKINKLQKQIDELRNR